MAAVRKRTRTPKVDNVSLSLLADQLKSNRDTVRAIANERGITIGIVGHVLYVTKAEGEEIAEAFEARHRLATKSPAGCGAKRRSDGAPTNGNGKTNGSSQNSLASA